MGTLQLSLFRQMADNNPDLLWIKDLDKKYLFVNKAMCDKLLIAENVEEPIGKTDMFFVQRQRALFPERTDYHTFGEICVDSDRIIIESEKAGRFEEFGNIKGKLLVLDVYKTPLFDEAGKLIGTVGCGRDITHEKKVEAELEINSERYRNLFESNLSGIFLSSKIGKMIAVNPSMLRIFGYSSQEEMLGMNVIDLYKNQDDRTVLLESLEKNNSISNFKCKLFKKDKSEIWVLINAVLTPDNLIMGSLIDISQIEISLKTVADSELSYKNLFNKITDAIYILDENGYFVDVNDGAVRMYGYEKEEFRGRTPEFLSAANRNDIPKTIEYIKSAFNGIPQVFEWWAQRKNGDIFSKEVVLTSGTYFGQDVVIATGRDISDRKRAVESIRLLSNASMKYVEFPFAHIDYQVIIDDVRKLSGASLAFITIHDNKNEYYISKAVSSDLLLIEEARKMLGFTLLDRELSIDELTKEAIKHRTASRSGGFIFPSDWNIPEELRHKLEKLFDVDVQTVFTICHQEQTLGSIILFFNKGKELKNAELMELFTHHIGSVFLRYKAEEEVSAEKNLFISGPIVVIIRSNQADFPLTYVSPNVYKQFGYRHEDLIHGIMPYTALLHPEDVNSSIKNLNFQIENNADFYEDEYRIKIASGEYIWVNDFVIIARDAEGQVKNIRSYLMDITSRKETEEKLLKYSQGLQESNITKDKFFSIIAHDLKNPFHSIMGFSDLLHLEYDNYTDEERKGFIMNIWEASESTHRLIQNLLDWSRAQTGRMDFDPQLQDLSIIANDTVLLMKIHSEAKNIKLFSEIRYNTLAFFDENMVKTVLRNLVSNAIKFSNTGGYIKIETSLFLDNEKHYIKLSVSDTGIGIAPENQEKLFRLDEKFVKVGTEGEKGTGLGLILCKELINKNNGKIWVESKEGEGSRFSFILPRFKEIIRY